MNPGWTQKCIFIEKGNNIATLSDTLLKCNDKE